MAALLLLLLILLFLLLRRSPFWRNIMSSSSTPEDDDAAASSSIKYDVFISFRGEDTRNSFTSHLVAALRQHQIETYFDEDTLPRGDEVSEALRVAIRRSKISLIVFSEDYASSSWCLGELQHILECHQKSKQVVIPIFYHVDPSDVRKQNGTYADAFKEHEKRYKKKMEMVQKWKLALTKSADLSGWDSQVISPEAKLVEAIAQDVLRKLNRYSSTDIDFDGLVGIEEHFGKIKLLLSRSSSNASKILGIWGMGGIGKTTIAEAVYCRLSSQFDRHCFLRNIREESGLPNGLMNLRDKLLKELLRGENRYVGTLSLPTFVKERLSRMKVLIVLDDVNDPEQLEILVGDSNGARFSQESIIIITTRNAQVLKRTELEAATYKVEELNYDEALQLFKLTAFRGKSPSADYIKLSKKVVKYAGAIPLALKILGSHLRFLSSESISDWEMILDVLKEDCCDKMVKILKISFDGLNEHEKAIFLDISCFFKGYDRKRVENILDGCGFKATERIKYLIDKSLITIGDINVVWMHDLVQEMGWNIVEQSTNRLGERSRLWKAEDGYRVLTNNQGTERIEGIFLDTSQMDEDLHLRPEVFQNMPNLRLLKISSTYYDGRNRVYCQDLQSLPNKLTYLHWERCPLEHFPSKFKPLKLVELQMRNSQLERVLDDFQDLEKLRRFDLSYSIHLTKIPDFSRAQSLVSLNLSSTAIKLLPSSINSLKILSDLGLQNCKLLTNIAGSMREMDSLKLLNLSGCSSLNTFPELPKNIGRIDFSWTGIIEVPSSSIEYCFHLQKIRMEHCKRLLSVPISMFKLRSLSNLSLSYCSNLGEISKPGVSLTGLCYGTRSLPHNFISISFLSLEGTNISEIPPDIKQFSCLQYLRINNCKKIESLPELPLSLKGLEANGCTSLLSTTNRALESFWDYPYMHRLSSHYSKFCGCLKLDKNEQNKIITEFQIRVLHLAMRIKDDNERVTPCLSTYCPGDEIPNWFSYSSEGSSIHIKLPLQWHDSNFFGFAACVVATNSHSESKYLDLYCDFDLKPSNKRNFTWKFDDTIGVRTIPAFDSDHVFMWYHYREYSAHLDAVEAKFNFSFIEYGGSVKSSEKIKKCGIRILYRQDIEDFNLIKRCAPSTIGSDIEEDAS